ncbi:MAG: hypothetical protein A2Z58_01060 [Planctomycetes bacterium RIFCSPHIGHO2_12_42_15]|nr:MAG: hypothetical protein A2Z58_01060 [Planctomycetes bacterium RIFCSPHIGHO2_12_42_15]
MITEINEAIKVGAIFGDNKKKLKPVWFIWGGKKYLIQEITYIWTERLGKAVIHHFMVADGANLFSISYNTDTLVWTLHSIETVG